MGLAGARNSAVTGLQAQSTNIAITSDNIANASTIGYKSVKGEFETLITGASTTSYSSGGVNISPQTLVDQQGLIEATASGTDLAISGAGFFAVQDAAGTLLLTRAGSFTVNNKGELTNSAGFKLLGWPLNNEGLLPGATGNTNTTAAESSDSLVVVDTNVASGTASATTSVKLGMNLNAGQTTFQGATVTLEPISAANTASLLQGDIIVPGSGMQEGDAFTLASTFDSASYSTTFTYGGFAKSKDISAITTYGATAAATTFSTAGGDLASGDSFSITTASAGTVTFVFTPSSPNTSNGQFNSLNTLATAINAKVGLTARVSNGVLYVSADIANEAITFADVTSGSNMVAELGFSNEAAATSGVNRFNTMYGLSVLANATNQIGAKVNNPTSAATIDLFAKDPLQTLTITKIQNSVTADLQSAENGTNSSTDVIVPPSGSSIANGDTITFSDNHEGTPNTIVMVYGGVETGDVISTTNTMFGASTSTATFTVGQEGLASTNTLVLTLDTDGDGFDDASSTFQYLATPLAATDFNSLATLATAINATANFSAKVVNGALYVAAKVDANYGVQFTSGGGGADFAATLGLSNIAFTAAGTKKFATLAQLQTKVDADANFIATVGSASGNATVNITPTDVSSTTTNEISIATSRTALASELGLSAGNVGDGFFTEFAIDDTVAATATATTVAVSYDPGNILKNMASGKVTPHFSRNMRLYDSLGTGHDFRMGFLKIGANKWAVELYALTPADISNDTNLDGLLASGTIEFNGDGSLKSVDTALSAALTTAWTTGSTPTDITFNFGTAGQPSGTVGAAVVGLTDGLRQFDTVYNVDFVEQNGVAAGQFSGIEVSEDGTVSAKFSNGQIKPIYQLPIITIANPNALTQKSGNVFAVTEASGEVNLKKAGIGGAGVIVPSALEGSTADIASELTKTIGIQANYNANATLISTVKAMEEELNRRL